MKAIVLARNNRDTIAELQKDLGLTVDQYTIYETLEQLEGDLSDDQVYLAYLSNDVPEDYREMLYKLQEYDTYFLPFGGRALRYWKQMATKWLMEIFNDKAMPLDVKIGRLNHWLKIFGLDDKNGFDLSWELGPAPRYWARLKAGDERSDLMRLILGAITTLKL